MARLINVECPNGHVVAVDVNDIGKKVRCPICEVLMIVPRAAAPGYVAPSGVAAPARHEKDNDDEGGETESEVEFRLGMKRVRTAMNLYLARLYVMVIGFILIFAWAFTIGMEQAGQGNRQQGKPPEGLIYAGAAGGIVLIVLEIVAIVFACSTPQRTGARGTFFVYVGLQVFFYILYFLSVALGEQLVVGVLLMLVTLATFVCFIAYLKKLAEFRKENKLVRKATGLFWLFGFFMAGVALAYIPMLIEVANNMNNARFRQKPISDISTVCMLVGFLVAVVSGIWTVLRYIRLLNGVRDSLKIYAKSSE